MAVTGTGIWVLIVSTTEGPGVVIENNFDHLLLKENSTAISRHTVEREAFPVGLLRPAVRNRTETRTTVMVPTATVVGKLRPWTDADAPAVAVSVTDVRHGATPMFA